MSITLNHVPKYLEASLTTSGSNPIRNTSAWADDTGKASWGWDDGFVSVGTATTKSRKSERTSFCARKSEQSLNIT